MKFREGHRGFEDLTDEEAEQLADELYAEECEKSLATEDPPEYIDEDDSPMAARILGDLEDDEEGEE